MKKIPTIFERDWSGDRSRVIDKPHPDCAWVFAGEGVATRKLDGTCCLVSGGALFKRRELKQGEPEPSGFVSAEFDAETGKKVGWMQVGDGPEDRWHREAFDGQRLQDGTYELIGPKIQGNPEQASAHILVAHTDPGLPLPAVPRSFADLRDRLSSWDIEGLVFHHPDGRMAKIKLRDFGLKRGEKTDG